MKRIVQVSLMTSLIGVNSSVALSQTETNLLSKTAVNAENENSTTSQKNSYEAYFFIESTKTSGSHFDSASALSFKDPYSMGLNSVSVAQVNVAFNKFFSFNSLDQGINSLQADSKNLNLQQRQLLMSMVGSKLASGYSSTGQQNMNLDSVYMNAILGMKQGGVCGDIHSLVSEVAKALNFTDVGTVHVKWQKEASVNSVGGHAISYYRDPQTGQFFVQNYSQIFATGSDNVTQAVEIATKFSGAITGATFVNTAPDKMHLYVPATSQWVQKEMQDTLKLNSQPAALKFEIGRDEYSLKGSFGTQALKVILGASKKQTDLGPYSLTFVGIAGDVDQKIALKDSFLDEVYFNTNYVGGKYQITAPIFESKSGTFQQATLNNYYVRVALKGAARINKTTGSIELVQTMSDLNKNKEGMSATTTTELNLKLQQDEKNIVSSIGRKFAVLPKYLGNKADTMQSSLKTVYDQIEFIYKPDTDESGKLFLKVGTSLYLMEGFSQMSAVAVKNSLEQTIKYKNAKFTIAVDYAKYVQNRSKDPFYSGSGTRHILMQLEKNIGLSGITLGLTAAQTKGQTIYPFGTIGETSPDMNSAVKQMKYGVYISVPLFGK